MDIDFNTSEWEASALQDGSVMIRFKNGENVVVKNDGVTGYEFVVPYLKEMRTHYPGHIVAADMLLNRLLGDRYIYIQKNQRVYESCLAVLSLNCAFGNLDHQPDREDTGEYHPEFSGCPFRAFCPFNGYNPRYAEKKEVCCNPVYETGMTPRQTELTRLLVDSSMSVAEIAATMNISTGRCKSLCSEVFSYLGVNTRQELALLLRDKRLL